MDEYPVELLPIARRVHMLIGSRNYAQIVTDTGGVRLPADQIHDVIEQCPARFSSGHDFPLADELNVVAIRGKVHAWSVWYSLHEVDGRRSDTQVRLTIKLDDLGAYRYELDDILTA